MASIKIRNTSVCTAMMLVLPYFAVAQEAARQASDIQDAPDTTQEDSTRSLGTVVVKATKRDESLVDVPITITAITSQEIEQRGITRAADFLSSIPNVAFIEDNAGEAYINIRGQTSVRNSDPNVALVIDGVTLSSVKPFNQDLFDIEQIEVLKGPQSALYGRNAAAGAIVITTKKPGDTIEGNIEAGASSWDTYRLSGGVGGPISDTLKFNIAGAYRETDGPFTNTTTGEKVHRFKTLNGRARLIFEPNEELSIDFRIGGHNSDGGSIAYNAQVVGVPLGDFDGLALNANEPNMPFVSNVRGLFDEDFIDATLNVSYDFGFATLNLITGANDLEQYYAGDTAPYLPDTGAAGATVNEYGYEDTNISQEIRLTSRDEGRFRWQVGAYYLKFERTQTTRFSVDNLGTLPSSRGSILPPSDTHPTTSFGRPVFDTESIAPFASIQYDISDRLHLDVAGRYDIEERSIRETAPDIVNPVTGASYNTCVALTGQTFSECTASTTFRQFEPKVSLAYDLAEDVNLYASYGEGFKSGGFNPIGGREALINAALDAGLTADSVYVQDGYDKEVSTSYEIGAKARLFDNRLSINAAAFSTKIEGAQQFEFYPTVGIQATISIDEVEIRGFDVDFHALLPSNTEIFGAYGYTDSEITSFPGNPGLEGNVAPGAFEYTLNLGATQTFGLANGFEIVPRVEYNRYGPILWDVANTSGTRRNEIGLLDARLSLRKDDRWSVSVWGKNITDEEYFQEVVPLLGFFTVNYRGPTESYGIEARYTF